MMACPRMCEMPWKGTSMPHSCAGRGGFRFGERTIECLAHLKVSRVPELRVLGYQEMDTGACGSPTTGALLGHHVHHAGRALASV